MVDGLGDLALPLADAMARALIQRCKLAPFGQGEQTIVDTQSRNTWQLSHNELKITNPAWQPFVDEIVASCYIPLGIRSTMHVDAELCKLLLYEVGGKFDRHQDSEKKEGMLGTLELVFPCRFDGGQLAVYDPHSCDKHEKKSPSERAASTPVHEWDAGKMDPLAVKYGAFYGDCHHEIKPVTRGYRLCLTYNLVCKDTVHPDLSHTANQPLHVSLKDALAEYFFKTTGSLNANGTDNQQQLPDIPKAATQAAPPFALTDPSTHRAAKLVYVLSPKYTASDLSFKYLKNKGALVAASLARYCDESNGTFKLFLASLRHEFSYNEDLEETYSTGESNGTIHSSQQLRHPWIAYRASSRSVLPLEIVTWRKRSYRTVSLTGQSISAGAESSATLGMKACRLRSGTYRLRWCCSQFARVGGFDSRRKMRCPRCGRRTWIRTQYWQPLQPLFTLEDLIVGRALGQKGRSCSTPSVVLRTCKCFKMYSLEPTTSRSNPNCSKLSSLSRGVKWL